MSSRTAGLIVIGDEILKGMTQDTNSFFISKKLYSMGVKLRKISVIPDEVETIAAEVKEFSKSYDVVITSGGIGPTHDDVTYEGVAKAFGEELEIHNEMAKCVRRFYPGGRTVSENPSLKMASLPTSATILTKCSQDFPIVRVFNVVMFPGIPQHMEMSFARMEINDLFPYESPGCTIAHTKFHCYKLYYLADEVDLVDALNKAVALFGKNVNFGSYPVLGKSYSTIIAIDSYDELLAARAKMYLKSELAYAKEVPPPATESSSSLSLKHDTYSSVSQEVSDRVFRLVKNKDTPQSLLDTLDKAIKTVGDCFTRYDSGNGVFISFNGGKDCTALLHLVFAFYTKYYPCGRPLKALYIQTKDPFPEVEDFAHAAALRYNIKLEIRPGPLKNALQQFMEENSELKAVFIGTRRTDPKSVSLQTFQMTDGDWPRMMRVSPLLDWSYENVWTFLRTLSVPYCSLYDEGYTSIGDKSNTFPNPALEYVTKDGRTKYHPAYMLKDESVERSGRQ
ncbi:FAD synthase-like isoform X2 [Ischnura elegans]|uniref:FAD synthase-like isoform X2 n=1 Tax=Ischnura elegans TaxID=197161 RepID=UPI001ED8BE71|nr:FAD synthase-like isoform X2 [Ischnura elegans]